MGHPLHAIEIKIGMSVVVAVDFAIETITVWWSLDGIRETYHHNFDNCISILLCRVLGRVYRAFLIA